MDIILQNDAIERIAVLIKERNLIPVFGAGFSMNSRAYDGVVPSGDKATELMKEILLKSCSDLKLDEIEDCDFNETAKLFYNLSDEVKNDFFQKYFTGVKLGEVQKDFLEFSWPYAYTLNVDDGIENTKCFKAVLPYKNLKRPSSTIKLLYKLHGDAFTEVTYQEGENIVFSSDQYLQAITDKKNKDFLKNLITDYSCNNMIFIGCSLKYEPDLKYVYGKSDHKTNTLKITLCEKEPGFKEKSNLMEYGINTIILIEDYKRFYLDIIRKVKDLEAIEKSSEYRFKNPVFEKMNDKDNTFRLLSGENIFDETKNAFKIGGMHILRNCLEEVEKRLETENCVILKGRRFSGKTYLISNLLEHQKRYAQYFFPSSSNVDEEVIFRLLINEKNSLFVFDSNSLSASSYRLIANSNEWLVRNSNKVVVAINSNDNYIAESLKGVVIEIPNRFYGEELKDNEKSANKYGLIKRYYQNTNMDYLQKITEKQRIPIFDVDKYKFKFSFNEQVILFLLTVLDKVYVGDALALDVSLNEIDVLKNNLPLLVEEISVDVTEKTVHSSTKLVHNSKVVLIHLLNQLTHEQIIECIRYIVEEFKEDQQRNRIGVNVILFDTLNQLFGGKSGAGTLIYKVYESLEDILNDSLHYWLQRAKCIYHIYPNSLERLKSAYGYAKKVYFDGGYTITSKAALTTALISCMIYKKEEDTAEKDFYLGEAVLLGYEAVTSDFYRFNEGYLNNELAAKKRRMSSYELLIEACHNYEDTHIMGDYVEKAGKLVDKLQNLKMQYSRK